MNLSRRRSWTPTRLALVVSVALTSTSIVTAAEKSALAGSDQAQPGASDEKCKAEIESIRKLYETIPRYFRDMDRPRLAAMTKRVTGCSQQLQDFLKNCPQTSEYADAHYMVARLRMVLADQYRSQLMTAKTPREELQQLMNEYHQGSRDHCVIALKKIGDDKSRNELICIAKELVADISFQMDDFDTALQYYLDVLKHCPDFEEIGNTVVGTARAYLELRDTTAGLKFIRTAIKERFRNENLPFFYEIYWNLLVAHGDIDGMIEWSKDVQSIFPLRMIREGTTKHEKEGYRRYLGFSGFRLGYSYFARGDLGSAGEAFTKHIETMDELEQKMASRNEAIPQELKIYRQRSLDVLRMIQDNVGEPPASDLDLQEMWVSPTEVKLADNKGKAVAILFRGYEDKRSSGIFQKLDARMANDADQHAFAAIHYLKGGRDIFNQIDKLRNELLSLGIENSSVGIDPDPTKKSIFRDFKAMVGSATLMIFDRAGQLMWWMQDPRDMDAQMIINIWDRLAQE